MLFGLGGESLNVCQSVLVSRWFFGKELALALGINITVSRLGSVINNVVEPPLAEATSLGWALFLGLITCIFSFVCGIILIFMEKYAAKHDAEDPSVKEDELEVVKLSDLKTLGSCYWVITFNCCFTYLGIFPFTNISNQFFRDNYNFGASKAGQISSTVFLISAFIAPIFGFLCDKIGHRVSFCVVSASLLTGAHVMFIVLGQCDQCYIGVVSMVMIGLAYSIYVSAIWPMIPYVVDAKVVGTAYGLTTAI